MGERVEDGWDVADARAPGSWDQSGVPPRLAVMLGRCSIQSQHRPGELGHSTRRVIRSADRDKALSLDEDEC
ncbi:hypothetical protein FS749_005598 [Ceratobasidium sp. UAMH 11750]|nr:hypothetical protein FS749_005598 [Ceratobasidium sp. UAMH 11750]